MHNFTGVKVFSATKAQERQVIGDLIRDWIERNPHLEMVEREMLQSSDTKFHCLTIILFFRERARTA